MAESTLEKRLRLEVKKHGGLALKFTSPGRRGVLIVWSLNQEDK